MSTLIDELIKQLGGTRQPDGSVIFSQNLSEEQKKILTDAQITFTVEPFFEIGQFEEESSEEKTLSDSQASDSAVAAEPKITSEEELADTGSEKEASQTIAPVEEVSSNEEVEEKVEPKEEVKSIEDQLAQKGDTALHRVEGIKEYWDEKCGSVGKKVEFEDESEKQVTVKISDDKDNEEFKYIDNINSATVITKKDEVPDYDYFNLLVNRAKNAGYGVIKVKDGCSLKFQTKLLIACAKNNIKPIGNVPDDFDFEKYKQDLREFENGKDVDETVDKNIGKINPNKAGSITALTLATLMMFSGCTRNGEVIETLTRKVDSLEQVTTTNKNNIVLNQEDIAENQDKLYHMENDTVQFAAELCEGKVIEGYKYKDPKTGKLVFKQTNCEEVKTVKKGKLKPAKDVKTSRTVTSKKKTTETKKETVKKEVIQTIVKEAPLPERDTLLIQDYTLDSLSNTVYGIKPINDTLYVAPGDTLTDPLSKNKYYADSLVINKKDTVFVQAKDGFYGELFTNAENLTGQNGVKDAFESYTSGIGEVMVGFSKMLKDSTVLYAEAKGTASAVGMLRDTEEGFKREYGTFIHEYAATLGMEIDAFSVEATAGRQRLNKVAQKYPELNFLDRALYGEDVAYISDIVAIKGKFRNEKGQTYEALIGMAAQTPRGSFFAGPSGSKNDGFVAAFNGANIIGNPDGLSVSLGVGAQYNDDNISGFGTVLVKESKSNASLEYTYLERNDPLNKQIRENVIVARASMGGNDQFNVKAEFVHKDGFWERGQTYGLGANWNIINASKSDGRNSSSALVTLGAGVKYHDGVQYFSGCCNTETGKIQRIACPTNNNGNKISAYVSASIKFDAFRKRSVKSRYNGSR